MGLFKSLSLLSLATLASCASPIHKDRTLDHASPIPENKYKNYSLKKIDPRQTLLLFYKGRIDDALDLSIKMAEAKEDLSYESIREVCKLFIHQSSESRVPEVFLSSLYGASIASSGDFYPILQRGLNSSNPHIQLASLQMYRTFPEDHTKVLLKDALGSRFLAIRMEAAYILASRKAPEATSQILSLMYKTPPELEPLFPRFFALIGDQESQLILKKLLSSPNKETRVQAILAIGSHKRDDLLEDLYPIATHTSP